MQHAPNVVSLDDYRRKRSIGNANSQWEQVMLDQQAIAAAIGLLALGCFAWAVLTPGRVDI